MQSKIKEIIKKSELSGEEKLEALIMLDEAFLDTQNMEYVRVIDFMTKLQAKTTDLYEKECFQKVIDKYRREIHWEDSEFAHPITLGKFLQGISRKGTGETETIQVPKDLLGKSLKVAIDDGMGYSPGGFNNVIDGYSQDDDIIIWI